MGTDAHAFISDLARGLEPRADQLVDATLQCSRRELPKLWAYQDIAAVLPAAASEHITNLLDFLEQGTETDVKTPPAAIELARLLAKHRVPISDLLRIYRLVQARLVHLLYEETSRLTDAPELINAATVALSAMGFEYVDRTAEQAVAAYQQERDRWLQRRLSVINEANTRIGTTLDTAHTAQELADVGTDHFADLVTVDLLDSALQEGGVVPAHVASAVRRVAQQSVLDACPDSAVDTGERHTYPEGSEPARSLATGQPLRHDIAGSDVRHGWRLPRTADVPCGSSASTQCSWSRCGPAEPPWASCSSSATEPQSRSTTRICAWPTRSRPEQPCTSTTLGATPTSVPRRSRSSAACSSIRCPNSPP